MIRIPMRLSSVFALLHGSVKVVLLLLGNEFILVLQPPVEVAFVVLLRADIIPDRSFGIFKLVAEVFKYEWRLHAHINVVTRPALPRRLRLLRYRLKNRFTLARLRFLTPRH